MYCGCVPDRLVLTVLPPSQTSLSFSLSAINTARAITMLFLQMPSRLSLRFLSLLRSIGFHLSLGLGLWVLEYGRYRHERRRDDVGPFVGDGCHGRLMQTDG